MKKTTWLILLLAGSFLCAQDSPETIPGSSPAATTLTILHTNDLHSRLNGYSPVSEYSPLVADDDHTVGGFARIASILERERELAGGNVLTLDAGDFLMGTFFTALEPSTGFQLSLMKAMGYDAIALGNHEFDFGPRYLSRIINSSLERSEIPPLLLSNIGFDPEDPEDDSLQLLFSREVIKPFTILELDSFRIALLSLMGEDAIDVAPSMRPARGLDPVKTCRKYVKQLRDQEKADLVILLSHTGMVKDKNGEWAGDDAMLAKKVKGIDLIISGHSHTELQEPVYINNIPIVQAKSYGEYVGKLQLLLEKGRVRVKNYELLPVDDRITGNPEIQAMIIRQQELLEQRVLRDLDLEYSTRVLETDYPLILDEDTLLAESNLGDFVSGAIYHHLNQVDTIPTDIAIFPAGMIRDNISPGEQTSADIFRVTSLGRGKDEVPGYPLARVYVTGKELKGIMEILYLSSGSSPGNFCFYGGLDVEYDPEGGFLKKVVRAELENTKGKAEEVDFKKNNPRLYSIAANSYLLEFLSMFKKLSYGLVKVEPKHMDGSPVKDFHLTWIDADPSTPEIEEIKAWTCLIEYAATMVDVNGNGIPDLPEEFSLQ